MIRAVIFDADHTLYIPDAEKAYEEMFASLSDRTGTEIGEIRAAWDDVVDTVQDVQDPDERSRETLVRAALERVGAEPDQETIEEAISVFWDRVTDDLSPAPGAREVVARLHEAGMVVAVATDEFPGPVREKLATVFDPGTFDTVVTPRDTGTMKPSETFYTTILEEHSLAPEEVIMVGDSWERDLVPAKALGMTTVLVGDGSGEPDHRIDTLDDLWAVVEEEQDGR